MSMESAEDPFAAVEADPLTGTTPADPPPVPASDDLPPGVEAGMLGGTDTPAPDPDAEAATQAGEEAKENMLAAGQPDDGPDDPPEPDAPFDEAQPIGENGGEDPSESPEPPHEESGAEDGTPLPPEPETAVADTPPPAVKAPKAGAKQGGSPSRSYFIFERIEIELGGEVVDAYVKRAFGNEDTIVARNGPSALKAAGRAIGDGYEGTLAPVPVSMWNPKPVSTKQKDNLSVSVG